MKLHTLPWIERGQMVRVDDHVTNVIRDIREYSDRIDVYWNEQGGEFDLVERCLDGAERLIFSTPTLDGEVVQRLRRADHWYGRDEPVHIKEDNEDFLSELDAANEASEAAQRDKDRQRIRAAGEEIAWALDIVKDRPSVGGSIHVPKDV